MIDLVRRNVAHLLIFTAIWVVSGNGGVACGEELPPLFTETPAGKALFEPPPLPNGSRKSESQFQAELEMLWERVKTLEAAA
ncbi:MAG: hypothetical protein R3C12_22990 [Planctomycetaceae bacterium]|nr:hypothetical protein [Planctomycetaceae bacterium]